MISKRILAAASAAALLLLGVPAVAHEAPSGWQYPIECCSSSDCSQVEDENIEEVPGGFQLNLPPGSHPMVKNRTVTLFVPHDDYRIRKSGDWRKHACVGPTGRVYCLFLVPGGT